MLIKISYFSMLHHQKFWDPKLNSVTLPS